MEPRDQKQGGNGCISAMLVSLLLPFVYFFSYGPVIWLVYNDWLSPAWFLSIRWAYYPLHWLAQQNSAFKAIFVWWVQLWGG